MATNAEIRVFLSPKEIDVLLNLLAGQSIQQADPLRQPLYDKLRLALHPIEPRDPLFVGQVRNLLLEIEAAIHPCEFEGAFQDKCCEKTEGLAKQLMNLASGCA